MSKPSSGAQAAALPVWIVGIGGSVLCLAALGDDEWIAASIFLLGAAVAFSSLLRALYQ